MLFLYLKGTFVFKKLINLNNRKNYKEVFMPKTKPQADKRREQEQRQQEKEKERLQQSEARALEFKTMLEQKNPILSDTKILSKKELRKQKKENKQSENLTSDKPVESTTFITNELAATNNISDEKKDMWEKSLKKTKEIAINDAKQEASNTPPANESARVVQNHSTHCEGLKPILTRLGNALPNCTIIPGPISPGNSHYEEFELRFQSIADEKTHTYKFVARKGYTSQDVLISTSNPEVFTEELIRETVENVLAAKKHKPIETKQTNNNIQWSSFNRTFHKESQNLWRERHQQNHQQQIQHEKEIERQKKIDSQIRTLVTKNVDPRVLQETAERDVDIISGELRGRYSMT
jgi:hypothetical protein